MPPSRGNSKKEQGQARKAEQKLQKQQQEAAKLKAKEDADWQRGANVKGAQRAEQAAAKADEAARKRREKEDLLKQEEEAMATSSGTGKAKKAPTTRQSKKKKKNDLSLLEDSLIKSAEQSTRAKKKAQQERQQQEQLEAQQQQKQQQHNEGTGVVDPLLQNTNDMLKVEAGRSVNKHIMKEGATSGLDAGLASLSVGGGSGMATLPKKSQKQLYKEFEERMLPVLKNDFPGLRLSQYQEKLFALWKKSPDNPMNQAQT